MYVFCVGMYRSASTWQYNVACHLVEGAARGRRIGFVLGGDLEKLPPAAPAQVQVLKSHDEHPAFARSLAEGAARGIYIHRDLRDVAYSMAHKLNTSFEEMLAKEYLEKAIANDDFWSSQPGMLCQKYEQVLANPVDAVQAIAKHLELPISVEAARALAQEYSFAANLERTRAIVSDSQSKGIDLRQVEDGVYRDDRTQLHWNHLRNGQIGGWRDEATVQQLRTLGLICGAWLIRNGYAQDYSWAFPELSAAETTARDDLERIVEECLRRGETATTETVRLRQTVDELRIRLCDFGRIGPNTFRLAQQIHRVAESFPKLRSLLKSLIPRQFGPRALSR